MLKLFAGAQRCAGCGSKLSWRCRGDLQWLEKGVVLHQSIGVCSTHVMLRDNELFSKQATNSSMRWYARYCSLGNTQCYEASTARTRRNGIACQCTWQHIVTSNRLLRPQMSRIMAIGILYRPTITEVKRSRRWCEGIISFLQHLRDEYRKYSWRAWSLDWEPYCAQHCVL